MISLLKIFTIFILISFFCFSCSTYKIKVVRYKNVQEHFFSEKKYFTWENKNNNLNPLELENITNEVYPIIAQSNFLEVIEPEQAKYIFLLKAEIDDGKPVTTSTPVFGQKGISSSSTTGTLYSSGLYTANTNYTPSYGVVGTSTQTHILYARKIEFSIFLKSDYDSKKEEIKPLYFARAMSSGTSSNLAQIIPYLLRGIFEDFKATDGEEIEYNY